MRRANVISLLILAIVIIFISGVVVWMLSDIDSTQKQIAPTIQEDRFTLTKDVNEQPDPDYDMEYMVIESQTQSFCSDPYALTRCQDTCDGALWEVPPLKYGFADCKKKCCALEYKEEPEQDKKFEDEE